MNSLESLEYRYDVAIVARTPAEIRAALRTLFDRVGCVRVLIHVKGAWAGPMPSPELSTFTGEPDLSDAVLAYILAAGLYHAVFIVPVCVLPEL